MNQNFVNNSTIITIRDASKLFHISKQRLYKWVQIGKLPHNIQNNTIVVDKDNVELCIKSITK